MITMLSGSLASPMPRAIGWALFHLLWQATLLAGVLAAMLGVMKRQSANARYLVSCGALLLLIALAVTTGVRAWDPAVAMPAAQSASAIQMMPDNPGQSTPLNLESTPATASLPARALAATAPHLPTLVMIWAACVLLLSLRLLFGWARAHDLARRNAFAAGIAWQHTVSRLARALNVHQAVKLLESAAVEVPTVVGFMRPVILLPIATLSGLSTDQIEMVLAHELAHIRRHDFLVNLFQSVIETLLFYHPAVWWISMQIRIERENCCDDLAVAACGDALQYARALTRFEELRVDPSHAVIAANGGSLLSRVRRLIGQPPESATGSSRWAAGAAILTLFVVLLVAPSLPILGGSQHIDHLQPVMRIAQTTVAVTAPRAEDRTAGTGDDAADSDSPEAEPSDSTTETTDPPSATGGRLSVDDLIALTDNGATPQYIAEMRAAGLGKLATHDLIAMAANGVTTDYLKDLRHAGCEPGTARMLVALRANGVSPEYVSGLRAAGLDVHEAPTLVAMSANGVSPEWVSSMKSAGVSGMSARDAIALRANGVDSTYVTGLSDAGYRNLTSPELIALETNGVTPALIKSLADAGYTNLTVRDLIRLASSGVSSDLIRDLQKYRTNQ